MIKMYLLASSAALLMFAAPAEGDELLNACIGVVEVEGQPEGIAGCKCLVGVVGEDEGMTKELLALAKLDAEERVLSPSVSQVIGQCFELGPDTENAG